MLGYANRCSCCFLDQVTLQLYSHCSSLPSYLNGDLLSTGAAAHRVVTSMGTWYYLRKQMPTVYVSPAGESLDGTSGAHTFTCGTWYSLLWVTSPASGGLYFLC